MKGIRAGVLVASCAALCLTMSFSMFGCGSSSSASASASGASSSVTQDVSESVSSDPAEPAASNASAAKSKIPPNDYYRLVMPEGLEGAEVYYEEGRFGGPTTVGARTAVVMDGMALFEVCCVSDDWGPQGTYSSVKLGVPSADPSCNVYLLVPQERTENGYDAETADAKAQEYAKYVTVL